MDAVPRMCLINQNRFDQFMHLPMEQRVRKEHSHFYPLPKVKISLKAAVKYQISIRLDGVENVKYTFSDNEWMVAHPAEYSDLNHEVILGTRLGEDWMNGEVPIYVRLCNKNGEEASDAIPLDTLMLYQPVIYVSELTNYGAGIDKMSKQFKFIFPCLKFMTVSDFKNPGFKELRHKSVDDFNIQQLLEQFNVNSSEEQLPSTSSRAANQTTENWIEGTKLFDVLAIEVDDEELNEWIYSYQAHTQNVYHPTLKYALLEEE